MQTIGVSTVIAFLIAGLLVACSRSSEQQPPASSDSASAAADASPAESSLATELIQRAETKVRSGVGFDPSKTQLRNVYAVEGNLVCGEIAWVDGTGKLRSFVPFMYRYGIEVKDNEDVRAARFAQVWNKLCEVRPVIAGDRSPLSEYQQEDFAQRLQLLAANGGREQPDRYHQYMWRDLEQIEQDLNASKAAQIEDASATEDAEAAEFVKQMRGAAQQK